VERIVGNFKYSIEPAPKTLFYELGRNIVFEPTTKQETVACLTVSSLINSAGDTWQIETIDEYLTEQDAERSAVLILNLLMNHKVLAEGETI
jgi:hypothetical protein